MSTAHTNECVESCSYYLNTKTSRFELVENCHEGLILHIPSWPEKYSEAFWGDI